MIEVSEKRFCQGNVGESVKVKIPDVDRARKDLICVLGVIMSGNNNIKLYIISLLIFKIPIFQ